MRLRKSEFQYLGRKFGKSSEQRIWISHYKYIPLPLLALLLTFLLVLLMALLLVFVVCVDVGVYVAIVVGVYVAIVVGVVDI